jgi:bla regulator protein blaR1
MGSCFYLVLNMSITTSAIGLVIVLLRLILRGRLPALAQYALWLLVLLRLLLPFSLPSEASILNPLDRYVTRIVSLPVARTDLTMTNSLGLIDHNSPLTITNFISEGHNYFPKMIRFKTNSLEASFNTLGTVWLTGAFIMCLRFVFFTCSLHSVFGRLNRLWTASCLPGVLSRQGCGERPVFTRRQR